MSTTTETTKTVEKPTSQTTTAPKPAKPASGTPLNLNARDPFADAEAFEDALSGTDGLKDAPGGNKIHIRIQQRNGRKTLTTLQGLPKEFDPKKILKAFKKEFACNGNVVEDEDAGQVIQLQGDQRTKIRQFLVDAELFTEKEAKEKIQIHGH